MPPITVISRSYEAERARRINRSQNILDYLFPKGGKRQNTAIAQNTRQLSRTIKERLKDNPKMAAALASFLLLGGGLLTKDEMDKRKKYNATKKMPKRSKRRYRRRTRRTRRTSLKIKKMKK